MTAATDTHGPLLIGFLFNATFYGECTMLVQSYFYFKLFRTDKLWTRILVIVIILLDTLNTVFDFAYLYGSLINHFGPPDDDSYLAKATWLFATDPILTGLIACLGQLFYAWRVKALTGNIWLTLVVVACSLIGLAGGVATTIEVLLTPIYANFIHFKGTVIIWLGAECLADIFITAILVLHLSSHKSGLEASDVLVDRIIRMTMQTGLATVVCAVVDLVLFLAHPGGLHLAFNIPLCKLYTNSLLSSLNARNPQGGGFRE
ncbi:hypothetical protein MSAN_01939100 [Mycena sanguinolenta]|uniref:DUF6534 domain-containing protein n=1 Tax=Mycena sanguinolenta TaxID=230812 RepID=A0A8H6XQM1_9AGAR|nr:hypothetical protein MSAN_01939100 [Mycena sanguinolenta]